MTPPVLLPAAVAVAAVALGLLLGLMPSGRSRWVGPLRTLALAAALTVVLTHLLPEAFAELGLPALVLFAATVAVPAWLRLVTRVAGAPERHGHAGLGLGYLGLLVHHVGDGLGLGAYGDAATGAHVDVLLALAVHTVPLVAVVTFAFRGARGARAAVLAGGGLAVASVVGVAAAALVPDDVVHSVSGWIAAGVSGLLIHVVTHDLERDLPATTGARLTDLAAAVLGVCACIVFAEPAHGMGEIALHQVIGILFMGVVPALLLAILAATALGQVKHSAVRRWLDPMPRPAFGLDGALCAATLGGVQLGVLFFVGLLLVTRAVALGGGAAVAADEKGPRTSFASSGLERVEALLPWTGVGLLLAAILLLQGFRFEAVAPGLALAAVLFVALPSRMTAACAVLLAIALAMRGLSSSAALAFAVVAAAPTLGPGGGAPRSRGRALWALAATLLVGIGIGSTSVATFALVREPPEWMSLASVIVLAPAVLFALFRKSVRGLLADVFPSHDSAPGEHHHEHEPAPSAP